jgi:uncharacterized SAM-binding protein YcdF (DUF218 family)
MLLTDASEALLPMPVWLVISLIGAGWWCRARVERRRYAPIWFALALWSWVFSTPVLANLLVRQVEGSLPSPNGPVPPRDSDSLIVVLASGEMWSIHGQPKARLDAAGWERMHAAVRLWRVTGGRLLVIGGVGTATYADTMASIAGDMGVPGNAIERVRGSSRTYEDLAAAAPVIRAHRGRTWLVTSALHMPRSLAVANKLGLAVTPYRCDYRQIEAPTWRAWLPNNGGPFLFAAVLHELLGRQVYRLRGWSI